MKNRVDPHLVEAMLVLAEAGALRAAIRMPAADLATRLAVSTATANRRLQHLEESGWIDREDTALSMTAQAVGILETWKSRVDDALGSSAEICVQGKLATGLGEGQYYLSREGYVQGFQQLVGYEPFPGTFNVNLSTEDASVLDQIRHRAKFLLESFQAEGRTFGGVLVTPARIQVGLREHEGAAIVPLRTHHEATLELIAPVRLRDALKATDGDAVKVHLELGLPREQSA